MNKKTFTILALLAAGAGLADGAATAVPRDLVPDSRMSAVCPKREPGPFGDYWWANRILHKHCLIEALKGKTVDLVMVGDSITHFWEWKHPKSWAEFTKGRTVLNLGYGGDQTQHVMWRIEHGELDGYKANVVTLMIGTNNNTFKDTDPANVAAAIEKIVGMIRERQPEATVVLHAILPRGDSPESKKHAGPRAKNDRTNALLKEFAERDGKVVLIDLGAEFLGCRARSWPTRFTPPTRGTRYGRRHSRRSSGRRPARPPPTAVWGRRRAWRLRRAGGIRPCANA